MCCLVLSISKSLVHMTIKKSKLGCNNSFFSFLLLVPRYECFTNMKAQKHCKILKITPRAYTFQMALYKGLISKGA